MMKGFCGSFLKLVQDAKAMAAGDMSEQQRLLTEMVLAGFKNNTHEPQPLFPLGFPKKKRSTVGNGNGNASSSSSCFDVLVCGNSLQDRKLKSNIDSDEQVLLAARILADLMKPEATFPIGFPKRKRFAVSRGMGLNQEQKKRIILKFKPSVVNGTASYSFSVCYAPICNNADVKPNPSVDDGIHHQKEGLVKLTMTSNKKRCFSEIEEHDGLKERNQKRVRNCGSPFLQHNYTNNALCF